LLFNAVKHGRVRSAKIDISQIQGTELQIIVSDAGPGFDPATLKKAGEEGGGFGLFSIRERLGLVGGRLEIESAPGKGSRFTLRCPIHSTPTAAGRAIAPPLSNTRIQTARVAPPMNQKIRVLVADDHTIMREGLTQLLSRESDIEIVGEAADGEAALRLTQELRPHIVLMDLSMPKLNGIEATRAIRSSMPEVEVIGLSMFDEAERAASMREAGAFAYLAKTGPTADLINAIRACRAANGSACAEPRSPNQ
jgi:CheY-like chemotaxis protein